MAAIRKPTTGVWRTPHDLTGGWGTSNQSLGTGYDIEYSDKNCPTDSCIVLVGFLVLDSTNITLINNSVDFVNKLTRNYMSLYYPTLPLTEEAGMAFRLTNTNHTVMHGNTVTLDNSANLSIQNSGFVAYDLLDVHAYNNTFSNVRECFSVLSVTDSLIENNTFLNCSGKAVFVESGSRNNVTNNDIQAENVDDFKYKKEKF